ncbi:MAG: hypothetical protein HQ488_05470 [Parcubacteria group bacterium]|nr:hypothetical protein [Parcubacteria group bacterium]
MQYLRLFMALGAAMLMIGCGDSQDEPADEGLKEFPSVELLYRSQSGREPDMAAEMASEWKQCLGVDVQVTGMPMDQWLGRVMGAHNFDFTLDGWQGDYPHPQTFAGLYTSSSSMNNGGFTSTEYDDLIDKGLHSSGSNGNSPWYQLAEQLLYDQAAMAPLFFSVRTHLVRPEWAGIEPNALMSHKLEFVRPSARGVSESATYFGGTKRNVDDDTFQFMTSGQPRSCDPRLMTSLVEDHIIGNAHQGLLRWGTKGSSGPPIAGLAESWESSEDGLTWTFKIREEARWSNGDKLTANDFQWSWQQARSPDLEAAYAMLFDEIGFVSGVATDDQTFVVTLSAPSSVLEVNMPMPIFFPVHQATVEANGEAWCQPDHFVGSGPFVVTEAEISDHITLEANPHYWSARTVYLKKAIAWTSGDNTLNVDMYRSGQRDWIGTQVAIPADQLSVIQADDGTLTVADATSYPTLGLSYVSFNQRDGYEHWQDARVRRAFSLALDRVAIEKYVLKNGDLPTTHIFPPGLGSYKPIETPTEANCEEAQRLFTQAGYRI